MCRSDDECQSNFTNASEITFTCQSSVAFQELPLYNYTTAQLLNITSIVVNGLSAISSGPFTSIPPNICLLPNLQVSQTSESSFCHSLNAFQNLDLSQNLIQQVDPVGATIGCVSKLVTLDLSYNSIAQFPAAMIYNMPALENVYFQHNRLMDVPGNAFTNVSRLKILDFSYNNLTTFELWPLDVQTSADFSYNQISTITNRQFFTTFLNKGLQPAISLTNNGPTINLNDGVYEMYNQCDEVRVWYASGTTPSSEPPPPFTYKLAFIDFGTVQINCSCDQAFIRGVSIASTVGNFNPPIENATCTNGAPTPRFMDFTCDSVSAAASSTMNFSSVYPRLCQISETEGGVLTNVTLPSPPTIAPVRDLFLSASIRCQSTSSTELVTCSDKHRIRLLTVQRQSLFSLIL